MAPALIHRLTGPPGLLAAATVACGALDASLATWDRQRVTCPQCQRACTCGPATTPCPPCRGWNRQHGARQTTPPGPIKTEKAFQEVLRRLALDYSWLYFHVHDSRKSPAGFVDTILVRGDRLIGAELKMPDNRPTLAQQTWLDALAGVTHVQACLWTPDDLETIVEGLR